MKAAENVEAEARQKAEEELRKAKQEAEQIRNSAKEDFEEEKNQHTAEMERYKGLIRKLESDYCSYKAKMKQIIGAQMEILDNPVYEMEFEVEEKEETKRQEENNGESES